MFSMLGFELDGWDFATFAVLAFLGISFLAFIVWLMGLPGRIAIARKHPDAEAVKVMGYAGFLAVVPWIQAFIWAFKPTDIIDIRRFPAAEAREIDEQIARLSGEPKSPKAKPPLKHTTKANEDSNASPAPPAAADESDKQS